MNLKLPSEFKSYRPNVVFNIDSGTFIIKPAETEQELLGAFRLRNSVFYEEWTGKSSKFGLDIDEYDTEADHLVVLKKDTGKVVGTYRLISSNFKSRFYTEKFFDIKPFLNTKSGNKVEIGRACVDKNLRNEQVVHFVWQGLIKYFRSTLSRYMFGSVSIIDTTAEYVACVHNTLQKKNILDESAVTPPLPEYEISSFNDLLIKNKAHSGSLLKLPRLFSWYLTLGAKIHGRPAYDPEFRSYDFFITLDFKQMRKTTLIDRYEDAVYLKNHLK